MEKWIKVLLLCMSMIPLHSLTQCGFTFMGVNLSACDPSDNSFDINGSVEFQNPPVTGQLIIEDCNGNQVSFNAPFTSPTNYSITGIDSDGTTGCEVSAYFTDETACTITSSPFDYQQACLCDVDAGTYSDSINGISTASEPFVLCYGDELDIVGNGDFVAPPDINMPGITYDPGVFLFLYDCLPTVFNPDDINTDTCFVGLASLNDQAWTIVNNIGDNSTLWYVPVTMYSMVDMIYAASMNGGDWCYDMGPTYEVTFLEEHDVSIDPIMEDTVCAFNGPTFLTASDTSGTWSSTCGICLDSNGVFTPSKDNLGINTIYYTVSDSVCNSQDSLNIYVDICGGISENRNEAVSIYPNPASTSVTVTTASQIEKIKLIDLHGKLHGDFTPSYTTKSIVDLNDYAQGIYLIEVTTNSGVFVNKLIVE